MLCPIREKWTKPVSALEIPASVHTTPAPSQRPPLLSEGLSSTCRPQRSAMVSLLLGGRERTAAWRPNILCFAVLTTRERDIEITQWPQRDSCFLFVNVRQSRACLRDCSDACTCVYVCIYVRVSRECVRACGVKRSEAPQTPQSWRGLILSFTLSLLFSVVLCCLVVFVMKKLYICLLHIMYVSEVQNI